MVSQVVDKEPPLPKGLNKNTSPDSKKITDYFYFLNHYVFSQGKPLEEAQAIYKKKVDSLPIVKESILISKSPWLRVEFHNGDYYSIRIQQYPSVPPRTAKHVQENLERRVKNLIHSLDEGEVLLLYPGFKTGTPPNICLDFSEAKTKAIPLFKCLMSNNAISDKFIDLVKLGVTGDQIDDESFIRQRKYMENLHSPIFTTFKKPSAEFKAHLKRLLAWKPPKDMGSGDLPIAR